MAPRGGFQNGLTDAVYPTRHDLLRDLLPIYQDEMRAPCPPSRPVRAARSTHSWPPTTRPDAMLEGVRDIIAGRRPVSDNDTLVEELATSGGDQIRKEFIAARGA